MRNRRKKLAQGRILRNTLAVSTGMDHQHTKPFKILFLFMKIFKHFQSRATGTNSLTATIRNCNKFRTCRQKFLSFINLLAKALRLLFI